jgi:hypothetical protein
MHNEPTDQKLTVTMENIPHGINQLSDDERTWFTLMTNSDIRRYYKLIRDDVPLKDSLPIGNSGITVGELALYIIRANHSKRKRRY